jgi:serine/threonine-protein kinase
MTTRKICIQCGAAYGPEQTSCPKDGGALRVESTDDPLIGQVVGERYHVTGLIGAGGMGRVYVAEHVRMGRKSALKVMSPALAATADAITRFNREAANAARINHPNVAAIYDFGETADGLLYIAMEFVEGETLHALIRRQGPLPIARAAAITRGVADALSAAHHLGIIHRDLKPDNVMLGRQMDGSDWVKVVDFGIAKSVAAPGQASGGQTVTTAGVSLGTPEYMSPEQLAGEQLDHRTDIYSLGLVLFNMLTGELPYPKLTSKETLVRRLTSAPSTLAEVRPDVVWPAAVQAVLTRALDPEPERRYASVADLGRAATAAAASAPTAAAAADDPDRTVRVSAPAPAPALAATSAHRPPAPAAWGSSPTRRLPAETKGGGNGLKIVLGVAALLLLATVGYAAIQARRAASPPAPAVVPAPVVAAADSAADSAHAAPSSAGVAAAPADTPVKSAPVRASRQAARTPPAAPEATHAATPAPSADSSTRPDPNAAAAVKDSSDRAALTRALNEIRGHMQAAGRAFAQGQGNLGAAEMRDAQGETKLLRDLMPNERMPAAAAQQLRQMGRAALDACYNAARGDQGGTERCRQFQLRLGRGGRGRGQPPPR